MKKIIFIIACCIGSTFNLQAASVGTMKIFTGTNGGVVTVQKKLLRSGNLEGDRATKGLVTLSDVQLTIFRNDGGRLDNEIIDTELPEVSDEVNAAEDSLSMRVSGRTRFHGGRISDTLDANDMFKRLTLNGKFVSVIPNRHTLELQDVTAEFSGDELSLSGEVSIDGEIFEIREAPEVTKKFIRRLAWLIRKS